MIYLDMDGVLADFDLGASQRLGMSVDEYDHTYGHHAAWEFLHPIDEFFGGLPLVPDAQKLLFGVMRYSLPTVLTALPTVEGEAVAAAKRAWVAKYLGPDIPVITCLKSEKANYCFRDDVLVDDQIINRRAWRQKGGIFIQHKNAAESLHKLARWLGSPLHD